MPLFYRYIIIIGTVYHFAVEACYAEFPLLFFLLSLRATIEEVEGDVCELESKLDKVSTTHGKHCMIVHTLHCEPGIFCGNLVEGFMFVPQLIAIIPPVTQRQEYLSTWLVLDVRIKGPRSDKRFYHTRPRNSISPSALFNPDPH